MVNCRNCIHSNSICKFENEEICKGTKVKDVEHECKDFKDNTRFIETPCKIIEIKTVIDKYYNIEPDCFKVVSKHTEITFKTPSGNKTLSFEIER